MICSSKIQRLPRIQGIYQLFNTKTGRRYIGASQHIINRLVNHIRHLDKNRHANSFLQLEYNPAVFLLSIIEVVKDVYQLGPRERFYIGQYNPRDLYNHPNAVPYEKYTKILPPA